MNLQKAVFSIFPACTLLDSPTDDGAIEVTGFSGSMVPQNCEVLATGVFRYSNQEPERLSYLIKTDALVLMVRVLPSASNRTSARIVLEPKNWAPAAQLH